MAFPLKLVKFVSVNTKVIRLANVRLYADVQFSSDTKNIEVNKENETPFKSESETNGNGPSPSPSKPAFEPTWQFAGLIKAVDIFKKADEALASPPPSSDSMPEPESFATLFRNSHHVQIGDANGTVVVGTVVEILDDDLYIDFGGKFPAVCKIPRDKRGYRRGVEVRLRLLNVELASKFLGADRAITLLEADAQLIGLQNKRAKELFSGKGSQRISTHVQRNLDDNSAPREIKTKSTLSGMF